MKSSAALKTTVRALGERARRGLHEHPPAGQLAAYVAGELAAADEDRLQDHLALCPQCAAAVLDLTRAATGGAAGREPETAGETLTAADAAADWRALEQRLGRDRRRPEPRPVARFVPTSKTFWVPATLAASFLATSLVFYSQVVSLRAAASAPRPNVYLLDLFPENDLSRSIVPDADAVPAQAPSYVLILNLGPAPEVAGYRARILDGGAEVWSTSELVLGAEGSFTLELAQGFLAPGSYKVELLGVDGEREILLARYDLDIE